MGRGICGKQNTSDADVLLNVTNLDRRVGTMVAWLVRHAGELAAVRGRLTIDWSDEGGQFRFVPRIERCFDAVRGHKPVAEPDEGEETRA